MKPAAHTLAGPLHVWNGKKEPIIIHTDSGREIARVTLSGYKVGHEPSYLEWAGTLAAAPELLDFAIYIKELLREGARLSEYAPTINILADAVINKARAVKS